MRKHNTTARTPKTPTSRRTEHIGLLTYLRDRAREYRAGGNTASAQTCDRWARAVGRLLRERAKSEAGQKCSEE